MGYDQQDSHWVAFRLGWVAVWIASIICGTAAQALADPPEVRIDLVARRGEQAPGTPAGTTFDSFFGPIALNDASEVAFQVFLDGDEINGSNLFAVFGPDDQGELSLIARGGEPAPGAPAGSLFYYFYYPLPNVWLSSAGDTAFNALIMEEGETFYVDFYGPFGGSSLAPLGLNGAPAPGAEPAIMSSSFPAINAAGQVALTGTLVSGIAGVDGSIQVATRAFGHERDTVGVIHPNSQGVTYEFAPSADTMCHA